MEDSESATRILVGIVYGSDAKRIKWPLADVRRPGICGGREGFRPAEPLGRSRVWQSCGALRIQAIPAEGSGAAAWRPTCLSQRVFPAALHRTDRQVGRGQVFAMGRLRQQATAGEAGAAGVCAGPAGSVAAVVLQVAARVEVEGFSGERSRNESSALKRFALDGAGRG